MTGNETYVTKVRMLPFVWLSLGVSSLTPFPPICYRNAAMSHSRLRSLQEFTIRHDSNRHATGLTMTTEKQYTPLSELSHNCVLFVDTNLIIAYTNKENNDWVDWANEHIRQNNSIYVPETAAQEFKPNRKTSGQLPKGFEVHKLPQRMIPYVPNILANIFKKLDLDEQLFANDLSILIEASQATEIQQDDSGSIGHSLAKKTRIFASSNLSFLRRCLGNPEKWRAISKALVSNGFDDLVKTVHIKSGNWVEWV